ncbi:phage antirepressor protein [Lachnospiraceae bacterium KM106-2]|nr:phage antirepressor protein [Lachnospiraceae bacterium KM106-2]
MNELQIFKCAEFGTVRTAVINGKPYFCGSDVAKSLGYSNANDALKRHCKAIVKHDTPISGKLQAINFIPEGDIFRLATHSKLPDADKFESWVFDEVLPSIHRKGGYISRQEELTPEQIMAQAVIVAQNVIAAKEEKILQLNSKNERLMSENTIQKQVIGELKPKADYTDSILQNKGLVTITQIAKDYGMSGNKMNEKLHELNVQYKQSGQWLLYSQYHDCGYTHSETVNITRSNGLPDIKMNTKWTQKGRLFLYYLLKKNGILPVVEKGDQ